MCSHKQICTHIFWYSYPIVVHQQAICNTQISAYLTWRYLCTFAFLQTLPTNPRIVKVLEKYNQLISRGKDIIFCWIPSHVGIKAIEEADEAAKEALLLNEASKTIVASDLGSKIDKLLQEEWQQEWESESNVNNKLKRVLPKLKMKIIPQQAWPDGMVQYVQGYA